MKSNVIHIFLIYLFVAVGLDCLLDYLNDFLKRKSNFMIYEKVKKMKKIKVNKETARLVSIIYAVIISNGNNAIYNYISKSIST